jgi:Flp pilus assembly pilin Flp
VRWLHLALNYDDGATLVEYALLLALIAMVCIASMSAMGCDMSYTFFRVGLYIR